MRILARAAARLLQIERLDGAQSVGALAALQSLASQRAAAHTAAAPAATSAAPAAQPAAADPRGESPQGWKPPYKLRKSQQAWEDLVLDNAFRMLAPAAAAAPAGDDWAALTQDELAARAAAEAQAGTEGAESQVAQVPADVREAHERRMGELDELRRKHPLAQMDVSAASLLSGRLAERGALHRY
jgi:hypothetical protein